MVFHVLCVILVSHMIFIANPTIKLHLLQCSYIIIDHMITFCDNIPGTDVTIVDAPGVTTRSLELQKSTYHICLTFVLVMYRLKAPPQD